MFLAGRGWGKTRVGAEETFGYAMFKPGTRQRIIVPTFSDGRDTCVEGESGLINIAPDGVGPNSCITKWNRSIGELEFYNGSNVRIFSAEEPERLRGSQSHRDWMDELGAWGASRSEGDLAQKNTARIQKQVWSMAAFGRRLPPRATFIITTTPKPTPLLRELVQRDDVIITKRSTYDNINNLDEEFRKEIMQYEGTLLGRQEIYAEILNLDGATIFKKEWFRLWAAGKPFPIFEYIVMSYDTAYTEKTSGDYTACSVWGIFREENGTLSALLIDFWKDRLGYPALRAKVLQNWDTAYGKAPEEIAERMRRFGREARGRKPDVMLIEEKGSGQSLYQDLLNQGVNVRPYNPKRESKETRAHVVSPVVKEGRVWIPESLDPDQKGTFIAWARPMMEEVLAYSGEGSVEHDDALDSCVQCWHLFKVDNWIDLPKRREDDDDRLEEGMLGAYNPQRPNPYAS